MMLVLQSLSLNLQQLFSSELDVGAAPSSSEAGIPGDLIVLGFTSLRNTW